MSWRVKKLLRRASTLSTTHHHRVVVVATTQASTAATRRHAKRNMLATHTLLLSALYCLFLPEPLRFPPWAKIPYRKANPPGCHRCSKVYPKKRRSSTQHPALRCSKTVLDEPSAGAASTMVSVRRTNTSTITEEQIGLMLLLPAKENRARNLDGRYGGVWGFILSCKTTKETIRGTFYAWGDSWSEYSHHPP